MAARKTTKNSTLVRNAFIKRAYKEACEDWKILIREECPQLFKDLVVPKLGNIYTRDGETYILARTQPDIIDFICLNDGDRWSDGISVNDDLNISEQEFNHLCNDVKFTPFKGKIV